MSKVPRLSETFSHAACIGENRKPNEDAVILGNGFIVLSDGATGLLRNTPIVESYGSDASWFSHGLCTQMARKLGDRRFNIQLAKEATELLRSEWIAYGGSLSDSMSFPSATLDVIEWDDEHLYVNMLGDSPVVVLKKDGSYEALTDPALEFLSNINAAALTAQIKECGGDPIKARELAQPTFVETRSKKNTVEGYWIADLSLEWQDKMITSEYDLDDISAVLACSDGFSCAVTYKICEDMGQLAKACAEGKGSAIAMMIRNIEENDRDMRRFLRTKVHDDCSFAIAVF